MKYNKNLKTKAKLLQFWGFVHWSKKQGNVFVHWGCYNKNPHTVLYIDSRNLFLTILEAEIQSLGASMIERGPPGWKLLKFDMVEEAREFSGLFDKNTNSFMRAPSSRPSHLPKAPPPNTKTLGIRTSKYKFWEDTIIQPITRNMPYRTWITSGLRLSTP